MSEIFVSYRRVESQGTARLIKFCFDSVFQDVTFIDEVRLRHSQDWRNDIAVALRGCRVVVALIGPDWATQTDKEGRVRLSRDDDPVRFELLEAARLGKPILPVLIDGAVVVDAAMLPAEVREVYDVVFKATAEIVSAPTPSVGASTAYPGLIDRLIRLLGSDSKAVRNARFITQGEQFGCAFFYDLIGFQSEIKDPDPIWKGSRSLAQFAPEFLLCARAGIESQLLSIPGAGRSHTLPTGGFIVFRPNEQGDEECLAAICTAAAKVAKQFLEVAQSLFLPSKPTGLHWPIDVRSVVAAGQITTAKGFDANGREIEFHSGDPILQAQSALALPQDEAPLLKRGEVLVIPGSTAFSLDGFRPKDEAESKFLFKREPPTHTSFHIPERVIEILKKRTLTTDEKAKDLERHIPPTNYCNGSDGRPSISELAKSGERICILTGRPGLGKTLCALRLVAELLHIDGMDVSVPPVAPELWEKLPSSGLGRSQVIFLDDAFGRTHVSHESEISLALIALEEFRKREPEDRPILIMTMRDDIWEAAAKHANWRDAYEDFRVRITEELYSSETRGTIFDEYWQEFRRSSSVGSYVRDKIAEKIRHPLSLRDFAYACAAEPVDVAERKIAEFEGDALQRLVKEIRASEPVRQLHHFFAWVFGAGVRDLDTLGECFSSVSRRLNGSPFASGLPPEDLWKILKERNPWGKWRDNGVFSVDHPLREEAWRAFFYDESPLAQPAETRDCIERIFKAFNAASGGQPKNPIAPLAAYAAAKVPGALGANRRAAIDIALRTPDGAGARSFATAAGQAWRRALNAGEERPLGQTGPILLDYLHRLLSDAERRAFGAAFGALCDSYSGVAGRDDHLKELERRAIRTLRKAVKAQIVLEGAKLTQDQVRVQNVEHAIWAIASNYHRLSADLRAELRTIAEDPKGQEWFRMRALEAVADYYEPISREESNKLEKGERDWSHHLLKTSVAARYTIAYRRAGIGAWDANFERIHRIERAFEKRELGAGANLPDDAGILRWMKDQLDTAKLEDQGDAGLSFLEWSIWVAGEHFDLITGESFENLLRRLSRHEDVRVRKWLTTALAECPLIKDNDDLRTLLTILARDDDDVVRGQAVDCFLIES